MALITNIADVVNSFYRLNNCRPQKLILGKYELLQLNKITKSNNIIELMGMELINSKMDSNISVE